MHYRCTRFLLFPDTLERYRYFLHMLFLVLSFSYSRWLKIMYSETKGNYCLFTRNNFRGKRQNDFAFKIRQLAVASANFAMQN